MLKDHPVNVGRQQEGKLPANYLLVRGAGKYSEVPSFEDRFNFPAAVLLEEVCIKALPPF